MFNPVSTYRIQFNKDFTFSDFLENIEYISQLGISTIYSSPVFKAVPGSMHGYDVTDPLMINPETGDHSDFIMISDELRKNNIGWIQDIVPNHMAFHPGNRWLMDVLEKGRKSRYASFFDIDFSHPAFEGKLMVPFLGKQTEEAVEDREITLEWNMENFAIRYFDFVLPCSYQGYVFLFSGNSKMPATISENFKNKIIQTGLNKDFPDDEWTELKSESGKLFGKDPEFRKYIETIIKEVNEDPVKMLSLLREQNYMLCYWKESMSRLNFRRFFTINSLICLKMESGGTFEEYHKFIDSLLKEERFQGLRIDHIDGLKRPLLYLEKLKLLAGKETWVVSEKILGHGEDIPHALMAQGTSGYDFLGIINNLFTHKDNYRILKNFYKEITGISDEAGDIIYKKKKLILSEFMRGEWENLARLFDDSGFITYGGEITRESVKDAIGEFLVCFPVYKVYPEYNSLSPAETGYVRRAIQMAEAVNPSLHKSLEALEKIFLDSRESDEERKGKARSFFLRCMQFTGPLMAKGVEDTVMYYYNCFIAHNEVGDHPGSDGLTIDEYHGMMKKRQKIMPLTMNSTSTHDTKRGEDVRARLNVISEIPGVWIKAVRSWLKLNEQYRLVINGAAVPDSNEEYFIYQSLAGVFPVNMKVDKDFLERFDEYLVKSLREAKVHSDWNAPDEKYESAVTEFVHKILKQGSGFYKSFIPVHRKIAAYGTINSLSQLVLKTTSPGIPDFYQGSELYDLSLVDPDNRRPVDYGKRFEILGYIKSLKKEPDEILDELNEDLSDGRMKLWMTHLLLELRKTNTELFTHGKYIPLRVAGRYGRNIIAYARVHKGSWCIVAAPLFASLIPPFKKTPAALARDNTSIILPDIAPVKFKSVFTGKLHSVDDGKILLKDVMSAPRPVVLTGRREKPDRYAGVLLHISSLPGNYGTGDLGPAAYDFADRLQENGQTYWQILPFNPVGEAYAYSPYSSTSAFAGNLLFLSPGLLIKSGLLRTETAGSASFTESARTDFKRALEFREMIADEIFTNFFCYERPFRHHEFDLFCERERYWLDDYALFIILRKEFNDRPWNEWPAGLKNRNNKTLGEYRKKFEGEIKKEKFCQYIFQEQWVSLKEYCNNNGIKLIGDMSFYVNYDSAEVWAHPEYFKLGKDKIPLMVAGVPPDYFSESGQLWNMPVYDWDSMKKDGYKWWINRIERNIELCDIVRFDHFRGFSEYWEVPYGENTAVNGRWTAGPGHDLFGRIREIHPRMPFIAEDLGTIDDKVHRLRDDFGLPGMSVLQFAFGGDMPSSDYAPHNMVKNSVVYTGTHDNNTTKGWFQDELNETYRALISEYAGHNITYENCNEELIRMAYGSVAGIAIIQVQDLLGLGSGARFNKPSTRGKNWDWKLVRDDLEKIFSPAIRKMAAVYGRI